jgi:hypothetical protein
MKKKRQEVSDRLLKQENYREREINRNSFIYMKRDRICYKLKHTGALLHVRLIRIMFLSSEIAKKVDESYVQFLGISVTRIEIEISFG